MIKYMKNRFLSCPRALVLNEYTKPLQKFSMVPCFLFIHMQGLDKIK